MSEQRRKWLGSYVILLLFVTWVWFGQLSFAHPPLRVFRWILAWIGYATLTTVGFVVGWTQGRDAFREEHEIPLSFQEQSQAAKTWEQTNREFSETRLGKWTAAIISLLFIGGWILLWLLR